MNDEPDFPIKPEIVHVDREVLQPEIVHENKSWQRTLFNDDSGQTDAIAALSFAISSYFVLPVVGAIAALILAHGAKKQIRQVGGSTSVATTAQVLSWINLALSFVILWAFYTLLTYIF